MRCRFLGPGVKISVQMGPGYRFSVQITQDQDHSHRAGIRPGNTTGGPGADKYGYGADIWRKNLQIEKQYSKNMNKTLRKPQDSSKQKSMQVKLKIIFILGKLPN